MPSKPQPQRTAAPRVAALASRGFTLVELLVVISIIALLISILLPGLGSARDRTRDIRCLANLRQLGIADANYLGDNRYFYPPKVGGSQSTWMGKRGSHAGWANIGVQSRPLNVYLGYTNDVPEVRIAQCPRDIGIHPYGGYPDNLFYNLVGTSYSQNQFSYTTPGVNITLQDRPNTYNGINFHRINEPSRMIVQADFGAYIEGWSSGTDLELYPKAMWHGPNGRFNLLFADGHSAPHHVRNAPHGNTYRGAPATVVSAHWTFWANY